ncbi:hypothetical protein ABT340_22125 [Streptosporangium sp. NPDC000239]|uniref:hypothetical protein n=1 Tax=Streptosporangium sp. NPDC000239 TaxID=3154248 RepID=UPI003319FE82
MSAPSAPGTRLRLLGVLLLGVAMGVALSLAASLPRSEVLHRDVQPATVAYDDGSAHLLALVRRSTLLGESHEIFVGRDPGLSYGHRVGLGAFAASVRTTEWTDAGVRVFFDTGHELFVPARSFVGGR